MKLISQDAVLAIMDEFKHKDYIPYVINLFELVCDIESSIKKLEVKVLELDDSRKEELAQKYIDYTFKRHDIDANSKEGQLIYYAYMHGMNQCLDQLRTKKGE